ncbi:MAG: HAD hydrolase family protein, partial [Coprobacter sp.]|nr:HAD hydrolase family protein [Coprobacter sp.]
MPHQERIDRRIFDLIRRLKERGILFCVASGRSYQELLTLFGEVKDDIYF